jgi:amino acid permease
MVTRLKLNFVMGSSAPRAGPNKTKLSAHAEMRHVPFRIFSSSEFQLTFSLYYYDSSVEGKNLDFIIYTVAVSVNNVCIIILFSTLSIFCPHKFSC